MLAGTVNNIIAVTRHNRALYTAKIIIKNHGRQHRRCLVISHLASYRAILKNQSTRRFGAVQLARLEESEVLEVSAI